MNKLLTIFDKYLIIRYIFSGGTSSLIDIFLFWIFIEFFGFHYIVSVFISITASFAIRFYLQKVLTFKDKSMDIHRQFTMYSILYILSLVVTSALLYVLIDLLKVWYMFAQIIAIGITASISFFVYRYIIFRKNNIEIIEKL